MSHQRCPACQKFYKQALEEKPFQVGDKVTFTTISRPSGNNYHLRSRNGVIEELLTTGSAVIKSRLRNYLVSDGDYRHQEQPNPLTISFVGICECQASDIEREIHHD